MSVTPEAQPAKDNGAKSPNEKQGPSIGEIAKHPLLLLLIGFVLTGIVGARLTVISQQRQAEIERDVRHYEASTTAIMAFSNSIYKRYVRAGFVKSAIVRRASKDEVKHRKELYDEAMVDQESSVLGYHLAIRDALKQQDYDDFEKYYQYALKPRLDLMDKELTALMDEYLVASPKKKSSYPELPCVDEMYKQVVVCNSAIVNSVFRSVSSKRYLSGKQVVDTQQKAMADLEIGCPLWEQKQIPSACQISAASAMSRK